MEIIELKARLFDAENALGQAQQQNKLMQDVLTHIAQITGVAPDAETGQVTLQAIVDAVTAIAPGVPTEDEIMAAETQDQEVTE